MRTLFAAFLLVFPGCPLFAQKYEMPKGVLRMSQYEDALKRGLEEKKPLALVMFDEDSMPKKSVLMDEAFDAIKGWTIPVYVANGPATQKEAQNIPPPCIALHMDTKEASPPKIFICSPREDIVWKLITPGKKKLTAAELKKDFRTQVAQAKTAMGTYFAGVTVPAFQGPGDKPVYWVRNDGYLWHEKFSKVEDETLYVLYQDRDSPLPLSDLMPASVRYAKALAALAAAPAAPPPAAAPVQEKWTNSKGKEIEATFVKLADGKVTLRLATGKDYTLPLTDLSAAGQARAKELAAAQSR